MILHISLLSFLLSCFNASGVVCDCFNIFCCVFSDKFFVLLISSFNLILSVYIHKIVIIELTSLEQLFCFLSLWLFAKVILFLSHIFSPFLFSYKSLNNVDTFEIPVAKHFLVTSDLFWQTVASKQLSSIDPLRKIMKQINQEKQDEILHPVYASRGNTHRNV